MMPSKIKNPEDFWAGVMFVAFGMATIVFSVDYPMGSAMRMGPGYFPRALGISTTLLGLIIALKGFGMDGPKIKRFAWRGVLLLALGFLIFGWGIEHVGFVPALFAMILCHALAGKDFKPLEALLMTAVLISGCVALFIYGLGLPFPLFWWR